MKKVLIGAVVIILAGIAYYGISPLFNTIEVDDELPETVTSMKPEQEQDVASGFEKLSPEDQVEMLKQLEEANTATTSPMEDVVPESTTEEKEMVQESFPVMGTAGHPAEGTVRIIETADGRIVRYENFSTINGPRLHVYLAKDLEGDAFIDLGPIRGTKGNINYDIPTDIDLSEYKYIMYWCVPFGVLFNYAEIM